MQLSRGFYQYTRTPHAKPYTVCEKIVLKLTGHPSVNISYHLYSSKVSRREFVAKGYLSINFGKSYNLEVPSFLAEFPSVPMDLSVVYHFHCCSIRVIEINK